MFNDLTLKMFLFTNKSVKQFVYKSIDYDWIMTFEVLPETQFLNNTLEYSKIDNEYVEQIINKAKLIKIEHKISKKQQNKFDKFYYQYGKGRQYLTVIIGDIVEYKRFIKAGYHDEIDGIFVYKSYDAAYYSQMPRNYTGMWFKYCKLLGVLQMSCQVQNGKKHGKSTIYNIDGETPELETSYINGDETGCRFCYFKTFTKNVLIKIENVVNSKRNGVVIYFNCQDGSLISKYEFENDKIIRKYEII